MCCYDTTGIQYACGHYIVTSLDRVHDCNSRYCAKSSKHLREPHNCFSLRCIQHYGPDRTQRTSISTEYCVPCQEGFFSKRPRR